DYYCVVWHNNGWVF
nr:immunoglobulin light chain junction region [Macaca mulatta]MOY07488.1 immunoglobulin light chain junction region [Macaca mulatta]MOY09648.1 immunoglobulin light chain junction region [Macaca mulatta]